MINAPRQEPTRTADSRLLERELAEIWAGQRFPAEALRLADGSLLRVIYRGRPGRGAGPDFRDAVVATADSTVLHGDVELHVETSDFRRHGHHLDTAYNGVVLHVVFHHDGGATLLQSGAEVLTIALAPWVARRKGELEGWLSRPPLWEEPCRDAVARLGHEEVRSRLLRLGQRRLRQKAYELRRRIDAEGADNAVYRELLEAIGYGPNREAFRALARQTSWATFAASAATLAELAASKGVVFEQRTRPGASAENRLQGAAMLLDGLRSVAGIFAAVLELVERCTSADELIERLIVNASDRTLIGRGRAAELAVNVVLPAALCSTVPEAVVLRLYEGIPDPGSYGLTAYLEGLLRRQHRSVVRGAAERQGLLLLQKEYCGQGGCGSCPLSSEGGSSLAVTEARLSPPQSADTPRR